ncbi:MAG: cytochrome c [Gemmatimonadaceae bacterium]|nr:cytochrome c [Gemmatimonadaceae bacterium]
MSKLLVKFIAVTGCAAVAVAFIGRQQPVEAAGAPPVHAAAALPMANKYAEVCQVCHQANGLGLEGAFPPLAGSEWLSGPAIVPIAIVLKGLQGEIVVKGKTYGGAMMAWEGTMSDDDVAATLTYARTQWGNRSAPVTVALVRAARTRFAKRTTPWTSAELKALK